MKGKVFLIGAGPGDTGLLTLRGRDCLAAADVVIYDALVNPSLLQWTRLGALKIFAGKRGPGAGGFSRAGKASDKQVRPAPAGEQREINDMLVRYAQRGRVVARLKGGDPLLFGRGGEEAAHLYEQNIPFEIVPGVSSASGAAGSPVPSGT